MGNNSNIITNIKRTILIADDEPINLAILSEMLHSDYDILTAENGQEALDILKSATVPVSLIMLDINMPVMNGMELLRILKADSVFRRIPVIVLTSEKGSELESLEIGAADFIKKPYDMPEVVHARVNRSIELSEDRLVIQATERDEVTGAYTEHIFIKYVQKVDEYNPDSANDLAIINIERYNLISEIHGHEEADRILRVFADALKEIVRKCDGIVGRLRDDCFAIYARPIDDYESVLEFIDSRLREYFEILNLSNRIGVYRCNDKSEPIERRIEHAKMACEAIRGSNRVRVMIYDEATRERAVYNERLLQEAREAIKNGQFSLYYQPKFNVTGFRPVLGSAEALVRWIHPELGFISPGVFIPLFENNGIIRLLDKFVWREAARQVKKWKDKYGFAIPVSVNVSRIDLLDPHLPDIILGIVEEEGVDPSSIYLEITESAYMDDADQLARIVDECRSRGFRIEIDDFGSGYSSLNTLATLSFDVLKLDMQFVRTMDKNEKTKKMIDIVADIARFLGVILVAEGVETKEQMEYLKSRGYALIQGYYFSKPIPAADFENKFIKGE